MGNHASHGGKATAGSGAGKAVPAPAPAATGPALPKASSLRTAASTAPYMRRDIADEGRELLVKLAAMRRPQFALSSLVGSQPLPPARPRAPQLFRKFAAHLDNQAQKAPHLGEIHDAAHPGKPGDDFGATAGAASFLSKFRFLEVVGAGSYSTVHRAVEKATGRPVAIKVIKKEILSSSVESQIRNEAALQKACGGHKNIVELLEFAEYGSELFFVMEFCPSTLLKSVLEENETATYSEAFAASAIKQTAAALAHIHSKGIVHLDIKPDNLLLSSGCSTTEAVGVGWFPDIKLADFGMAARAPVRRTVGTLFYVAPEILTEGWADQAADMWSLGVVLYVLLCGFPPFMPPGKATSRPIESQIVSGSYAFYSPYWDEVSAEAKDLVARLLVVDPAERLTAKGVLAHSWFKSASVAALHPAVKDRLRSLPAKKRFQQSVHMVTSMLRLAHASEGARAAKSVPAMPPSVPLAPPKRK